jgi:formate--tetrahydrofolate ligase
MAPQPSAALVKGGEGARELAEMVVQVCDTKKNFHFLYDLDLPLRKRIELIAKEVYGASGVTYTDNALKKIVALESDPEIRSFGTCMVKTQLSLSHIRPKGRPTGWEPYK